MDDELLKKFNKVEEKHWWWEGRRQLIKKLVRSGRNLRILDVGCGTGETMSYLKKIRPGSNVFGVDVLKLAVIFSKKRGNKNTFQASALDLPFEDDFFDAVLFLDVLEHIKDDNKAIAEAKRVLRKNGVLIITSPAQSFIWSKHDSSQGHYKRYSGKDILKLAVKNKMKVDFVSYFNFFLSPPIILIRSLSNLPGLGGLASYDRGINYEVAFWPFINNLLRTIFVSEVKLIPFVKYPFGISLAAKLIK